jgi:hypothetical protein
MWGCCTRSAGRDTLAEDVATPHILTLDRRDFAVLRWRGRRTFQIHPQ